MDIEKIRQGTAIIRGELGGAKVHPALAALVLAINPDSNAWPDRAVMAIADIDSALELGEANRARANEMENRYRAESLRANELDAAAANQADRAEKLQARNDNQAATIQTFEQRHREAMKAAESLVAELDEARESCKGLHASVSEWKAEAQAADRARKAATERADKAESQLARLMKELGGLTLSMLPPGAYGGALADAFCDVKAGR